MTPKEKAKELFDKMMYHIMYNCQPTLSEMVAIQCALIAIDEIYKNNTDESKNDYWIEVKKELEEML